MYMYTRFAVSRSGARKQSGVGGVSCCKNLILRFDDDDDDDFFLRPKSSGRGIAGQWGLSVRVYTACLRHTLDTFGGDLPAAPEKAVRGINDESTNGIDRWPGRRVPIWYEGSGQGTNVVGSPIQCLSSRLVSRPHTDRVVRHSTTRMKRRTRARRAARRAKSRRRRRLRNGNGGKTEHSRGGH